jgi:hypothetical protein
MFIMFEFLLIFIYSFGALVWRWALNMDPITPMVFNRWLIEACYAPIITMIFLYLLCRYPFIECPKAVSVSFHAQFACIIRLFLFFITRYAKFYPSSRVKRWQVGTFYIACNMSTRRNISHYRPLQFSLYHF